MPHDCKCCEALKLIEKRALGIVNLVYSLKGAPLSQDPNMLLTLQKEVQSIVKVCQRGLLENPPERYEHY